MTHAHSNNPTAPSVGASPEEQAQRECCVWRLVGVWRRWKSRWAEYRRKKAEDNLMWDYWMAKDAYERGDITDEQFFYDERFFPGWKAAIDAKFIKDRSEAALAKLRAITEGKP